MEFETEEQAIEYLESKGFILTLPGLNWWHPDSEYSSTVEDHNAADFLEFNYDYGWFTTAP